MTIQSLESLKSKKQNTVSSVSPRADINLPPLNSSEQKQVDRLVADVDRHINAYEDN